MNINNKKDLPMISKEIKDKVKNSRQMYLLKTNKKWFNHYFEYITSGTILHVGNGLGYASSLIKEKNHEIVSVDIEIHPDTINRDDVIIYDGDHLPYQHESFDVVLCDYVIHHTPNPQKFVTELKRVVKRGGLLIVIEQTHTNFLQRIRLLYNCRKQNKQSGQKVTMYWRSYFSRKSIREFFASMGFEMVDIISEQRKSSFTEMFVLRKID